MFDFSGKVALVTGASRGIGRATAIAFGKQGAEVLVHYGKNEAAAREVAESIVGEGGKAHVAGFDVSDPAAVEQGIEAMVKRVGRLDVLVANAGISRDGLALRLNYDDLEALWQTNVRGALASAKAALRPMLSAKKGRIVFVSSVVAEMGNVGQTAYATTKAALIGAARSLARECASRNITVNVVAPGFIDTDMTSAMTDAMREQLQKMTPLGTTGKPEDVAAACVYLASDEARYVTGQVLGVNGGLRM